MSNKDLDNLQLPLRLTESDSVDLTLQFRHNVIRSKRRRKTSEAILKGSVLEIRIPACLSEKETQDHVDYFANHFKKKMSENFVDLDKRSAKLASKYGLSTPKTIRWVNNQNSRWGSCTPADSSIRLSNKLINYPNWVIDYVIVHELAHLDEANHSSKFWDLVNRFPLTERARGFLIAKGLEE